MTSFDKTNVIVSGSRSAMGEYANYTTVFPKPTLVGGKMLLTQSMISKPNTKYVIKWNFELAEDITIPANCVLQFDGGSISGNYYIDFRNCANNEVYASWFKDINTFNNSIRYCVNKTILVDKDLDISEALYIPKSNFVYQNIVIRGISDYRGNYPTITSHDCECIKSYGYFLHIENISFKVIAENRTIPCLYFDCPKDGLNDVDCKITNCHFKSEYGNAGIVCYGRGLHVENCLFQTNGIVLYPKSEPDYPSTRWHDEKNGNRAIVIRKNRLHLSGRGVLVALVNNPDNSTFGFNGVQICDNLIDADSILCQITAKNYGTQIIGNINYARYNSNSIEISTAVDLLISNNMLGMIEKEQDIDLVKSDIVFVPYTSISANYYTVSDGGNELNSIMIANNFLGSYNTIIDIFNNQSVLGLSVIGNMLSRNAFTRYSEESTITRQRGLVNVVNTSIENCLISDNVLSVKELTSDNRFALLISNNGSSATDAKNIVIKDNINLFGRYSPNNNRVRLLSYSGNINFENITEELPYISGEDTVRPQLESFDKGYSYFNETYGLPTWWNGNKWIEADKATCGVKRNGTSTNRPASADTYIGFMYFDKTINKPIWWNGDTSDGKTGWVDATGATV